METVNGDKWPIIRISWTEKKELIGLLVLMNYEGGCMRAWVPVVFFCEWAGWSCPHPRNNLGGHCPPWLFIPCSLNSFSKAHPGFCAKQ